MTGLGADAALSAKASQDAQLVDLKRRMDRLKSAITPTESKEKKLRKACVDFEAVFINKLWQQMRATVPKDPVFDTEETDMYRSIFDHDLAEKLAGDGGVGLGDMLYNQLQERLKNSVKSPKADKAAKAAAGRAYSLNILRSTAGATSSATTSATATTDAADATSLPAAVSGDVMPDVEALARRIVSEHERGQAAGGVAGTDSDAGNELASKG